MCSCIEDVVVVVGVLIKIVFCVFNNELNVCVEICDCVLVVVVWLGYKFNLLVCSLVGQCLYVLVLVYNNLLCNYLMEIQNGMLEVCYVYYYNLILGLVGIGWMILFDFVVLFENLCLDGVVLILLLIDDVVVLFYLEEYEIFFISIVLCYLDGCIGVCMDEIIVVVELIGYLVVQGYWCIVYIKGLCVYGVCQWWYVGYCKVFKDVGIVYDFMLVVNGEFLFEFGVVVVNVLFDLDLLFIVIFVVNDDMVVVVFCVVGQCGLCILCDLLVCGFDDMFIVGYIYLVLIIVWQFILVMGQFVIEQFIECICLFEGGCMVMVDYVVLICELICVL